MGSVSKMVSFVKEWCADDSHGYSQNNRWGPDCDCSSLMYMAAAHAGYGVPTSSRPVRSPPSSSQSAPPARWSPSWQANAASAC